MKQNFLPIILGTDANAYGLARSFYEEYSIKSLSLGVSELIETKNSKIIDVKIYKDLKENFKEIMKQIGKEYKEKYDKLILLSCAEWYTDLIVTNRKELEKYFILPFMDKKLKDKLEDKESFYNICEKYNLDYPKTYIATRNNYNNINLPFSYPVALKPSSSTEYSKVNFEGKEKSYKVNNEKELKQIINNIYKSNYTSNIIIQDFIPGEDDTMYVMNCYSNKEGKVKMMCLGRCILEEHTPYGIGNYKAIISDGNKELYEKIKNFLEDIKYVGFSNFDLKYDYRDKKYKLFEINIRQGRSSFFTTAAGLNLSKYIVEDYIENQDKKIEYNYNKHLWLATPKNLLKKYVYNKECLEEAKKLIKEKKYTYTLKYKKDKSLYRWFWINRIYLKDYKLFKLYPPKDDE
ncbi:MAG: ATP-grasp domain-containing protein [Bacilli bacterium]|nr:ATP-grasp domain-containing protein [Bacilli bacterium]